MISLVQFPAPPRGSGIPDTGASNPEELQADLGFSRILRTVSDEVSAPATNSPDSAVLRRLIDPVLSVAIDAICRARREQREVALKVVDDCSAMLSNRHAHVGGERTLRGTVAKSIPIHVEHDLIVGQVVLAVDRAS